MSDQPRYNICPTTQVDTIVRGDDQRSLVPMRWGLIPGWWKKPQKEMRLATLNARAETVAEKPMFRDSFKKRRCLIPASGYYEWRDTPEGKQPYYFTRRDGQGRFYEPQKRRANVRDTASMSSCPRISSPKYKVNGIVSRYAQAAATSGRYRFQYPINIILVL